MFVRFIVVCCIIVCCRFACLFCLGYCFGLFIVCLYLICLVCVGWFVYCIGVLD